ncbi:carbohydrate ABC transporter permease [Phytoactinopolyspora endophytica]|uniref:carbohydrate ABC transporter permease n=1 Tax=Phytoactinopolyspora endophytica TaxID=1642495 RepID=UPI0013EC56D2|nr:carbohydrate ABC transporter permease [Phytoactinopolyspora endophytica]
MFPIIWLLSGSLQTGEELYSGEQFFPQAPQWTNYVTGWVDGNLAVYLGNSLFYTLTSIALILAVASLAGYALARIDFSGKAFFTVLILAVMVIPAPAMFITQYKLLLSFGLTDSRLGYIFILVTAGIPMSTLIMRSFFVSLAPELEEAASIDGASAIRTFVSVILPLARPGLAAVAVIQGLQVWNEYLMALVLFDSDSLMPVQRGLMSFVSVETPQQQVLLAATAISIVPVVIFYLLAQKHIIQGLGAGGVK